MNWKYTILAFLVFPLLFLACQSENNSNSEKPFFGYQYHPLRVGQELIYQNDSILYDDFTGFIDTISYQTRYLTESINLDLSNREVFVIGVYRRDSIQESWRKLKVIRKFRGKRFLELLDDNQVLLPLIFPIDRLETWDVNAKNPEVEKRYAYRNLHRKARINSLNYDSTIVVSQRNEENLIERFLEEEIYATRVGLVHQRKLALETEFNGTIRSGYDFKSKLISNN